MAENRKIPVETLKVPHRLLLTYQRGIYDHAKELIDGKLCVASLTLFGSIFHSNQE